MPDYYIDGSDGSGRGLGIGTIIVGLGLLAVWIKAIWEIKHG